MSYFVVIAFLPLFFPSSSFFFIFYRFSAPLDLYMALVTRIHKDHKTAWYSGSTQDSFKICLREDKGLDGLHKNIIIVIFVL